MQGYAKNRSILEDHSNCSIVIEHLCSAMIKTVWYVQMQQNHQENVELQILCIRSHVKNAQKMESSQITMVSQTSMGTLEVPSILKNIDQETKPPKKSQLWEDMLWSATMTRK